MLAERPLIWQVKSRLTIADDQLTTVTRQPTTVTDQLTTVIRQLTAVTPSFTTVTRALTTVTRALTAVTREFTAVSSSSAMHYFRVSPSIYGLFSEFHGLQALDFDENEGLAIIVSASFQFWHQRRSLVWYFDLLYP